MLQYHGGQHMTHPLCFEMVGKIQKLFPKPGICGVVNNDLSSSSYANQIPSDFFKNWKQFIYLLCLQVQASNGCLA